MLIFTTNFRPWALSFSAASALLLAACGGGGGGSSDDASKPSPTPPLKQLSLHFTEPQSQDNVHTVGDSVLLQVELQVDGQPAPDDSLIHWQTASATLTAPTSATSNSLASNTLHPSQPGSLEVQASASLVGAQSASATSPTLYIRPPSQPLEVLVPAYFSGGANSPWKLLASGAQAHPQVSITAILNPSNGKFTKVDPQFTAALEQFKSARQGLANPAPTQVIGYVMTEYGRNRSLEDIKRNIDNYLKLYPQVDGFFIDEMNNANAYLDFYQDIYQYIKAKGQHLRVVGNPGTFPHADYAKVADTLVTFEGKAQDYRAINPQPRNTWVYAHSNNSQAMLVHNAASCQHMQEALNLAEQARTHAGVVYITDLEYDYQTNTGNPWARLPQYWLQLLGSVQALNQGQELPDC